MRIEVSIAKTTALPNGALEALNNELSRRIAEQFPAIDSQVSVRYATGNQLSVFGALKEDKDRISEILQETWESADDWKQALRRLNLANTRKTSTADINAIRGMTKQ